MLFRSPMLSICIESDVIELFGSSNEKSVSLNPLSCVKMRALALSSCSPLFSAPFIERMYRFRLFLLKSLRDMLQEKWRIVERNQKSVSITVK